MFQINSLPVSQWPAFLAIQWTVLGVSVIAVLLLERCGAIQSLFKTIRGIRASRTKKIITGITILFLLPVSLLAVHSRPTFSRHDGFSIRLAAQTFMTGRLSNPQHPCWESFETVHVLSQPNRQSKYPIGQPAVLTLGLLLGDEYFGIILLTALLPCAAYWSFRGLAGPFPSFFAAILVMLHPGFLFEWGRLYDGGQLALIGGLLLSGSAIRLARQPTVLNGTMFGIASCLLFFSRLAEGGLYWIIVVSALLVARHRHLLRQKWEYISRCMVPLGVLGAGAIGWQVFYNSQVTGATTMLPYQLHTKTYMTAPIFFWQKPTEQVYRNDRLRDFYGKWELSQYTSQTTLPGWLRGRLKRCSAILFFYFPPGYLLIAAYGLKRIRHRLRWYFLMVLSPLILIVGGWIWLYAHYVAPFMAPALFLVPIVCVRLQSDRIARTLVLSCGLAAVLLDSSNLLFAPESDGLEWSARRNALIDRLEHLPGDDVILVNYSQDSSIHREWVYNEPDIDSSAVIWARNLDGIRNQRLMEHFPDRRFWMLHIDPGSETLSALDRGQLPEASR